MTLRFNNLGYQLNDLARKINYRPLGYTDKGELNCVRPLGADYPRFHVYMSTSQDVLTITLHLDQKRPSYEGATAHSGDYDSDTVKEEAARIREAIFALR